MAIQSNKSIQFIFVAGGTERLFLSVRERFSIKELKQANLTKKKQTKKTLIAMKHSELKVSSVLLQM